MRVFLAQHRAGRIDYPHILSFFVWIFFYFVLFIRRRRGLEGEEKKKKKKKKLCRRSGAKRWAAGAESSIATGIISSCQRWTLAMDLAARHS